MRPARMSSAARSCAELARAYGSRAARMLGCTGEGGVAGAEVVAVVAALLLLGAAAAGGRAAACRLAEGGGRVERAPTLVLLVVLEASGRAGAWWWWFGCESVAGGCMGGRMGECSCCMRHVCSGG